MCASAVPGQAQNTPTIRISTPPIDAGAQPFYAKEMGFFKKVGLNVEITTANSGAAVAAAVAGGAADIGQSNLSSLASAHERGLPFVMIAGANQFVAKQHQSALLVAANSPLSRAEDFAGKTVAVSGLKNITEIGFDLWMEQNGAAYRSVKIVEMPFATMAEAIVSGRIDGAMSTEPELSQSLASKRVKVAAHPLESVGKEFLVGGLFTTQAWARAHPDAVKAYRQAMSMAADWANRNQDQSAQILQRATGILAVTSGTRVLYANRLDPKEMQPVIDASARYGALKTTFPAAQLIFTD
jgi:NitT/TauT family transport system substrate-binding protein